MKTVLYSAVYGKGYDRPRPLPGGLDVEARMYTDDRYLIAPGWQVFYDPYPSRAADSPMMAAKWWKTHPHEAAPDADVTLWVDGSMEILYADYGARCLEALGDDDAAFTRHPVRSCIYEEAEFSAPLPRYAGQSVLKQVAHYRDVTGHPPQWGLIAAGAMVRRHTPGVLDLGVHWWRECVNWTYQDQLSLPVLLRENPDKIRWNSNLPWATWWHWHEQHGS